MRAGTIVIWFVCAVFAHGIDYDQLNSELEKTSSRHEFQRILKRHHVDAEADSALAAKAGQATSVPVPDEKIIEEIRSDVRIRALASGAPIAKTDVRALRRAKQSPIYSDSGAREQSNWLQKSLQSFGAWVRSLFDRPERDEPAATASSFQVVPGLLTSIVWLVIGAVAIAAIVIAGKLIIESRRNVARSKGLISDEEAKLSLDEWLARADALIAQGLYREAVRCLYVACLLRLDQAKVMEFRRHETNWEHLDRFDNNPGRPAFDLLTPTREFDFIWYGHRTQGLADAERFKAVYQDLLKALKSRRVA